MDIEPFGEQHRSLRAAFSCGVEPLDRYLKQQASQDVKRRAAVPYVLVSGDGKHIAGYYTLSFEKIRADDLPPSLLKQFDLPRYPAFGATLIGRLARDLTFQGQGIGELLLTDALKVSLEASRRVASAAVLVDAKDSKARAFYSEFGFMTYPETERRLFLPMVTIEALFR